MSHNVAVQAEAALRAGDLLTAHDRCASAIAGGMDGERLRYLQVLALARMGDTRPAMALYRKYDLAESQDVDSLSLRGRLLKDAALAAEPNRREPLLLEASEAYRRVLDLTGSYFPAINAASLALLGGNGDMAAMLARAVLEMPTISAGADYYAVASRAEALLILGDTAAATSDIAAAAAQARGDEGARSSTRRQLLMLAAALGLDDAARAALIEPLKAPTTMMFAGHMFREGGAAEAALSAQVDALLARRDIRIGYGALACGADIVIAEALLRRGGELNVVLPFDRDDFEAISVRPGGAGWISRFRRCMDAASSVDQASQAGYVGDDHQFGYGALLCMGLARLRARHLGGEAIQLAVWDGSPATGAAGTAVDVAAWQRDSGQTEVVPLPQLDRALDRPTPLAQADRRELRAIIFSDFAGFSKLTEPALPTFWREVMGRAGDILRRHPAILGANSWGDAVFAHTAEPSSAAEIALELQAAIGALDMARLGLGTGSGMRFGVHYGPVYVAPDPVTGHENIFGTEVTRTARIEPITPTGDVYVTQQFAAILAMRSPAIYATDYVGTVKLAKDYGRLKMFRLSRR